MKSCCAVSCSARLRRCRLHTSAVLETDPQRIREWIQQNLQELGAYSTLGFVGITLLKSIGLLQQHKILMLSNKVIFTDPRYCRLYLLLSLLFSSPRVFGAT